MKAQDNLGNLFYKMFIPICKAQGNPKEMDLRCKKCGDCLAKTLYKCAITAFAFYIMKDADFMPTLLGGNGDYSLWAKDHPYP
jgi:hypothetical protein